MLTSCRVGLLLAAVGFGLIIMFSGSLLAADMGGQGVVASYYGAEAGEVTASGTPYDPTDYTAAHPTLPFGHELTVYYPAMDTQVNVVVNDRGPYVAGRGVDLSQAAAEELGLVHAGVDYVVLY